MTSRVRRSFSSSSPVATRAVAMFAVAAVVLSPLTVAPGAYAASKPTLTRTSTAPQVEEGKAIAFTGTAPTTFIGDRVVFQRKVGVEKWATVKNVKVNSKGKFSTTSSTRGAGTNHFRVYGVTKIVKKGKKKVEKRSYAKSLSVRSLGWFHLYDLKPTRSGLNRYVADLNGKTYAKSLGPRSGGMNGWAEVNLRGYCDQFRATVGQDDYSDSGTRSRFASTVDGVTVDHGIRGRGKALGVTRKVAGAQTLRVSVTRVTSKKTYWGMWGNARVRCAAKPWN